MVRPDLIGFDMVVVGPTASGKTRWAISWARDNNAEIISADSRQIYKHLDIGTGKPSPEEQEGVTHHLIDVLSPEECYSAGMFRRDCLQALNEIKKRGKKAVLAGGTGLYLRTVMERFLELPVEDPDEKREFYAQCDPIPSGDLFDELKRIDRVRASEIMQNDRVRITRALWIHRLTGKPPSVIFRENTLDPVPFGPVVGLLWTPEELSGRISHRIRQMIGRGWVSEVEKLLSQGYGGHEPAFQSLGYPEILSVVRDGVDLEDAIAAIEIKTRQYAKRQRTWFRHLLNVQWLTPSADSMFNPGQK